MDAYDTAAQFSPIDCGFLFCERFLVPREAWNIEDAYGKIRPNNQEHDQERDSNDGLPLGTFCFSHYKLIRKAGAEDKNARGYEVAWRPWPSPKERYQQYDGRSKRDAKNVPAGIPGFYGVIAHDKSYILFNNSCRCTGRFLLFHRCPYNRYR
jgi:hypothetical protein